MTKKRQKSQAKQSKPCSHLDTNGVSHTPQKVIRFPYRPSVMTLLRRIRTTPRDMVSANPKQRLPNVYASYQLHWDKFYDVPVLTVAAGCDTAVHSPVWTRTHYMYGTLDIEVARQHERHVVSFELPLDLPEFQGTKPVVLDFYQGLNLDNKLNSYVLHPSDLKTPIVIINLWNLCSDTCNELHLKSVIQLDGVSVHDEHYVLGLSGDRDTRFKLEYDAIDADRHFFLDFHDLVHIGFYNTPTEKPIFIRNKNAVVKRPPIANMFPSGHVDLSKDKQKLTIKDANYYEAIAEVYRPQFYPPSQAPLDVAKNLRVQPDAFPPGYYNHREILDRRNHTVQDALDSFDAIHPKPKRKDHHVMNFAAFHVTSPIFVTQNLKNSYKTFVLKCGLTDISKCIVLPKSFINRLDWCNPIAHSQLFHRYIRMREPTRPDLFALDDDIIDAPLADILEPRRHNTPNSWETVSASTSATNLQSENALTFPVTTLSNLPIKIEPPDEETNEDAVFQISL